VNTCHSFAPSIRAASANSAGWLTKNWRIRNVPSTVNIPGRINAQSVSYSPSFWK